MYKKESILYIDITTKGGTQNTFVEQFNKEEKKSPSNHLYASELLEVKAHAMFKSCFVSCSNEEIEEVL